MAATQVTPLATTLKTESANSGDGARKKRAIEDIEEEIKAFEARFEDMQRQRVLEPSYSAIEVEGRQIAGRWRKWSGEWTPRPIGVL